MADLEPVPDHPRGRQACDECGSAALRPTPATMLLHVETGRVYCPRCVERGLHKLPLPLERPVTLGDLIR